MSISSTRHICTYAVSTKNDIYIHIHTEKSILSFFLFSFLSFYLVACEVTEQRMYVTVAILAQGTSWAVAVTQAFFGDMTLSV